MDEQNPGPQGPTRTPASFYQIHTAHVLEFEQRKPTAFNFDWRESRARQKIAGNKSTIGECLPGGTPEHLAE